MRKFGCCRSLTCVLAISMVQGCSPVDPAPEMGSVDGLPREKIIALSPHLTELAFTAGAGESLVGAVEFSDYPAAARQLPRVGDAFRVDYEIISSLEPDLILVWPSGNPAEVIERLEGLGFEVVELEPRSLEEIADNVETIGRLAGTTDISTVAALNFRTELGRLRDRYRSNMPLRVFYQVAAPPYFTVSGRHVISEIIEVCGGRNVFSDLGALAPLVTLESVLAADPEVIIAASIMSDRDETGNTASWRVSWRRWENLAAVRNDQLYSVDADLIVRSSTRILEGARQICEHLEAARLNRGATPAE